MRKLFLELSYDSPHQGEGKISVRKEVSDAAIKQCVFGRPFDLLAEIQDMAEELNTQSNAQHQIPRN